MADMVEIRPYDPDADEGALWPLKRAFERELGGETGDEAKAAAYEAKLDDEYRDRYRRWVDRCRDDDPRCLTVAATDDGLAGYAFVLPERLAMIWDAAVLNEVYVRPDHRGIGVADDLLSAATDLAADQSLPLDRLVLDVDPDNERAVDFYRRHGFEPWGEMLARSV
jgi:ribosomal protein S18 acetylase RimI-like enzyme